MLPFGCPVKPDVYITQPRFSGVRVTAGLQGRRRHELLRLVVEIVPNCAANRTKGKDAPAVEETTATIEQSFCELEASTEALRRATKIVAAETGRATKAAASGDLKTLNVVAGKLRAARQNLDLTGEAMVAAVQACEKTVDRLSGGYLEEVMQQILSAGGEALPHEGQLLCYPSIVRVNADTGRVTIDGRTWKSIRPSALAAELLKRQKRPGAFRSEAFLEALHNVYRRIVTRDEHTLTLGAPVPLVDIYELMTALPGTQRDYQRIDFARDLYRLETSGTTTTRKGMRMRLMSGSTGAKNLSRRLTFIAPGGREITYYGIRFGDQT